MLNEYTNLLEAAHTHILRYGQKPTKAGSLRIRKLALQLSKRGAPLRRHMIKLDGGK